MPGPEVVADLMSNVDDDELFLLASESGVSASAILEVADVIFRPEFRELCKDNRCGNYGRNWRCPPEAGDIYDLMAILKKKTKVMVFSYIGKLKSSYDWVGMTAGGVAFSKLVKKLSENILAVRPQAIVLGAGPCKVCDKCAILTEEPCRFPDAAVTSLEACGVDVSQLAKLGHLKYNNGPSTITYFGAVFI
jgi:predicted metal-binding protein